MNDLTKKVIFILAVLLLLGAVAYGIQKLSVNSQKVTFYYPDWEYETIVEERRILRDPGLGEKYVANLVEQYLLGPLAYGMKLNIAADVIVEDVWYVEENDGGIPAVIINFSGELSNDIVENNETYGWMIIGLQKTLKENTDAEEIYILQEGEFTDYFAGDFSLAYPVKVR